MSADNRTVATDALETLGTIIGKNEKRDAIHLGVDPVIAAHDLTPGDHIGLKDGKAGKFGTRVGIVDPFLPPNSIKEGDRFWLVVYPRQITSLRHVWEHPDFPASVDLSEPSSDKATSEEWLRNFIAGADCPDYETVIAAAVSNDSCSKEYLHFNGSDAHGEIPHEFWGHVEIVTGRTIPPDDRAEYFSCSC